MIFFVGVVWQIIIFESVYPAVIVHVDPKEKLWPVNTIAQKWLVIIRKEVLPLAVAILIEIRDKVSVFVVSRKYSWVGDAISPNPKLLTRYGN